MSVQLYNWPLSCYNCMKGKQSSTVTEELWWFMDSWYPCRQSDFCSLPCNCWSDASLNCYSLSHRKLLGKAQRPSELKENKLITSGWLSEPWCCAVYSPTQIGLRKTISHEKEKTNLQSAVAVQPCLWSNSELTVIRWRMLLVMLLDFGPEFTLLKKTVKKRWEDLKGFPIKTWQYNVFIF